MKRWMTAVALATSCLTACGGDPVSPLLQALDAAEAQWKARSFADYSFEMKSSCFCAGPITEWQRIEVVGGVITRVSPVAGGPDLSASERAQFRTIDGLFASIRRDITESSWLKSAELQFHSDLGYPTMAHLSAKPDYADAGVTYDLRNAGPLP